MTRMKAAFENDFLKNGSLKNDKGAVESSIRTPSTATGKMHPVGTETGAILPCVLTGQDFNSGAFAATSSSRLR